MPGKNFREVNGMWNGGRRLTDTGYILVNVGRNHHLADVNGYAAEHRLVAEEMADRRLEPGEIVHHVNGNKEDNRPENLEILPSIAHHMVRHRVKDIGRRLPGEPNPTIECLCGCGATFSKYRDNGIPRSYVSGHNPSLSPTSDFVLASLRDGPKSIGELSNLRSDGAKGIKMACYRLLKAGEIRTLRRGVYALPD